MGTVKLTREIDDEIARQSALIALERELTPTVQRSLLAYARRRERWLVVNGVRSAVDEAATYVADAVSDTAIGAVLCGPGVSIVAHLRGVIRGRTARIMDRARSAPHASVDDPDLGAQTRWEMIGAVGTVADPSAACIAAEQTTRVVEYVEAEAADDAPVLDLLCAYQAGARGIAEVIEATGMRPGVADAARKRLDRILDGMPADDDECDLSASGTWWV